MSTKKKVLITVGVFAVILALTFSIIMINVLQIPEVIECERLTAKYGHEFEEFAADENGWSLKSIKILNYGNTEAEIYCVWRTPGDYLIGIVNDYKREPGEKWEFVREQAIWSDGGTLDGVVMPYWWHNIPS